MTEKIIAPVDPEVVATELTPERLLRRTNKSDNEIYVVTSAEAPRVMREIGRLREAAFRYYGGGTGHACDVDPFDAWPSGGYRQLIVWNPRDRKILGGYRFRFGAETPQKAGAPSGPQRSSSGFRSGSCKIICLTPWSWGGRSSH